MQLEHLLERAGAIAGVSRYGSYLGVARPEADALRMVAILPGDGLFAFAGLEPGAWVLSAVHSNASIGTVPLVTVTVEAGRTTWVDVDREGTLPVRLRGRVVDGRGPVAGAQVRRGREQQQTDLEGRFEFGTPFPLSMQVSFRALHEDVEYEFEFSGMPARSTSWEGELRLGDEDLRIETQDALGGPAQAQISLSGRPAGHPNLQRLNVDRATSPAGELALSGLVSGTYVVIAIFADSSTIQEQLELPRSEPVVLRARPTGEVLVLVRTSDGAPAAKRQVVATTWLGEGPIPAELEPGNASWVQAFGETDAEGRVLLRGVAAGTVRVGTYQTWGSLNPSQPPKPVIVELAVGDRAQVVFDELPPP